MAKIIDARKRGAGIQARHTPQTVQDDDPAEQREIPATLDQIFNYLDELENRSAMLISRISPILRSDLVGEEKCTSSPPSNCPFGDALGRIKYRIAHVVEQLEEVTDRVEL